MEYCRKASEYISQPCFLQFGAAEKTREDPLLLKNKATFPSDGGNYDTPQPFIHRQLANEIPGMILLILLKQADKSYMG